MSANATVSTTWNPGPVPERDDSTASPDELLANVEQALTAGADISAPLLELDRNALLESLSESSIVQLATPTNYARVVSVVCGEDVDVNLPLKYCHRNKRRVDLFGIAEYKREKSRALFLRRLATAKVTIGKKCSLQLETPPQGA